MVDCLEPLPSRSLPWRCIFEIDPITKHPVLREVFHDYVWEAKGRQNINRPDPLKYPKIPCTKSTCLQQEKTQPFRDENRFFSEQQTFRKEKKKTNKQPNNNKTPTKLPQIFAGAGEILMRLLLPYFQVFELSFQ